MAETCALVNLVLMNLQTKKFTLVKTKLCISDSDQRVNRSDFTESNLKNTFKVAKLYYA